MEGVTSGTYLRQTGASSGPRVHVANVRFLERKICNPLVNVADKLKKLRGSGQHYLVNVKIVLM